jgi:hypothetical protein
MNDSLEQPSPLQDVPSYATGGTVTDDFARLVANWATDAGLGRDAALIALGATTAFLEARQKHRAGATEQTVRSLLSAALAGTGMAPHATD